MTHNLPAVSHVSSRSVSLIGSSEAFKRGLAAYNAKNYANALTEWKTIAEQGNASAQYNLGLMYDTGEVVPLDYAEAMNWYRLAAQQGHAKAQSNFGLMYHKGKGVLQDLSEAMKWYRRAAEHG
jgi:TPR repeat protein